MIHIIRHKDYDFPIPSGYVACEVGPLFKGDRPNINELNPIILVIPIAERFKEEDFNRYPHYYSRMIGFIAERLLTYYIKKMDYSFIELPYNEF